MVTPLIQNEISKKTTPWMQCPHTEVEYPSLAFIYPLDQLIVAEKRDALHDIIGLNGIAYTIFNSGGQKVFLAVLTKRFRYFNVKIFNNYGNEVVNVKRPFTLCANRALVWAPPGNYVGSVKERKCWLKNTYKVKNSDGETVLRIVADGVFQYVYKVYVLYGTPRVIGAVKGEWPSAAVLNVKNFGVSFPADLDVRYKAVLLGACFLILPNLKL